MEIKRTTLLIFLIFLLIYWLGSFSKIPFGDCVGFVLLVEKNEWQSAITPMSHFLFSNTAILLHQITSLDAKIISKIFVVTSSAFCVAIVYNALLVWIKKDWIAIATAFVFGLSFTFWRNSEIVEVYTFYAIWLSLYLLNMIKFCATSKSKYLIYASLFYGISFWVHILSITILPGFLLLILFSKSSHRSRYLSIGIFILLISIPFILNSIQRLPFNSFYSGTKLNWLENSFTKSFFDYLKDLLKAIGYLLYNFNVFAFVGLFGFWKLYQKNRNLFWILFISAIGNFGFATIYAVTDNYVFFFPFNIIFALIIGYGLLSWKWKNTKQFSYACLLIPLFYIASYTVAAKTQKGKEFNEFKSYKGGLTYYLIPWLNDNVGIVEITLDNRETTENIEWMKETAREYIKIKQSKGMSIEEIEKL